MDGINHQNMVGVFNCFTFLVKLCTAPNHARFLGVEFPYFKPLQVVRLALANPRWNLWTRAFKFISGKVQPPSNSSSRPLTNYIQLPPNHYYPPSHTFTIPASFIQRTEGEDWGDPSIHGFIQVEGSVGRQENDPLVASEAKRYGLMAMLRGSPPGNVEVVPILGQTSQTHTSKNLRHDASMIFEKSQVIHPISYASHYCDFVSYPIWPHRIKNCICPPYPHKIACFYPTILYPQYNMRVHVVHNNFRQIPPTLAKCLRDASPYVYCI